MTLIIFRAILHSLILEGENHELEGRRARERPRNGSHHEGEIGDLGDSFRNWRHRHPQRT